ncbi:hypothetical protein ACFL4G_03140, partial [Thermodesulfobacteriota bacterium]
MIRPLFAIFVLAHLVLAPSALFAGIEEPLADKMAASGPEELIPVTISLESPVFAAAIDDGML